MIPKPIDQITKEDIESLVAAKVSERTALDYKAQLNVSSDGDKREFLSDVSSFANCVFDSDGRLKSHWLRPGRRAKDTAQMFGNA